MNEKSHKYLARNINGILILDKPTGMSSNKALQKVKKLYKAKKAGHGGSLDPLASGLLPIYLGEATKFSRFSLDADKQYIVEAQLGIRTDTADSEGSIIAKKNVPSFTFEQIEEALSHFKGEVTQIPPMFSAIKQQGQPLYKLARQGIVVPRAGRVIQIYSIKIINFQDKFLTLNVHCSKGTYIRTLVDDLGEALQVGAHVIELRRITSGVYDSSQMVSFDDIEKAYNDSCKQKLDSFLLPIESTVQEWPVVLLAESECCNLQQGRTIIIQEPISPGWVILKSIHHKFIGMGELNAQNQLAPRRLINQNLET